MLEMLCSESYTIYQQNINVIAVRCSPVCTTADKLSVYLNDSVYLALGGQNMDCFIVVIVVICLSVCQSFGKPLRNLTMMQMDSSITKTLLTA